MGLQKPRVAIVGATGAVGNTLLDLMTERGFEFESLELVASARSAGRKVAYSGEEYTVCNLENFDFSNTDIAFFSCGTPVSKRYAPVATSQGALVIDNTNAFRMDKDSPLVVPQVNGKILRKRPRSGVIANPNCSTIPVARVVHELDKAYGLKKMIVSTYQAASGGGLTGIEDLHKSVGDILNEGKAEDAHAGRFPEPLGYNVIPAIDVGLETGFTLEEQKILQESRKILELPELKVSAHAVRVPVVNGHSESVYFETEKDIASADEIADLIRNGEEVEVYHQGAEIRYPTPVKVSGSDFVHVGRIRKDRLEQNAGWFWVVSDNLKVGAALNAVQIAEKVCAFAREEV